MEDCPDHEHSAHYLSYSKRQYVQLLPCVKSDWWIPDSIGLELTRVVLFHRQIIAYILAMALFAGAKTTGQIKGAFKQGYLPMMKTSWTLSPLSMMFAQKFLPPTAWVPFFNLIAFVFGTYVNTSIKKARLAQIKKEQQRLRDAEKRARDEL